MDFALVYLAHRFLYRIGEFFRHWYVDGSRKWAHAFLSFLERLDRTLALKVTLRHFFEPLYKDYTLVGRILGVIFRTVRVLAAVLVYGLVSLIFLSLYLLWILAPVVAALEVFRNL